MCNISRGEVSVDSMGEQLHSVKAQLQNESGKHELKTAKKKNIKTTNLYWLNCVTYKMLFLW